MSGINQINKIMRLTYKHITVRYNEDDDQEISGYGSLEIPKPLMMDFLNHHDHEVEYDVDALDEWKESGYEGDKFTSYHADLHIMIFNYLLEEVEEDTTLDYYAAHPFWFYHDCQHAENDVWGSTIEVSASIEEKRVTDTLIYMVANTDYTFSETDTDDMKLLCSFEKDFRERWQYGIDTSEMFKLADLEEEYDLVENEIMYYQEMQ